MSEIIPNPEETKNVDHFINFLKHADAVEGAVSNEISQYDNILNRWRKKEINENEAIAEAKVISEGRGSNYH